MESLTQNPSLGAHGCAVSHEDLLRHGGWIRGFCRSLVGAADADDLAQETWLVALRRSGDKAAVARPRPWLASVARRLAFDRWKRSNVPIASDAELDALVDTSARGDETAEVVQQSELAHLVVGEVLALSEPNRTTLILRYCEGLDAAAIGRRLGVPAATVRSRIRRGLDDVRVALDRRHGGKRERWLAAVLPFVRTERTAVAWFVPAAAIATAASLATFLVLRTEPTEPATVPVERFAAHEAEGGPGETLAGIVPAAVETSGRAPVLQEDAPAPSAVNLVAPRVRWHSTRGQLAPPLVVGDRVISAGKGLACLSADDGRVLWEHAGDTYWSGAPAHHQGAILLVHVTGGVASVALEDGRVLWQRSGEEVRCNGEGCRVAGSGSGALCLVGTGSGITALRANSGETAWTAELGGEVQMRPATDGKRAFAGTTGGTFCAVDLADGRVLWRNEGGAKYGWTDPVVANGVCYVGDRGRGGSIRPADRFKLVTEVEGNRAGALNAFDAETGELRWGRIFGATGFADPYVTETEVWSGFGTVVASFAVEDGSVREERLIRTGRNAFGSPRAIGEQIVFGNLDGHLYTCDRASHELLWSFAPVAEGDAQVGGWTAAHGRLYVSTSAGLFALEDRPDADPVAPGTRIVAKEQPEVDTPDEAPRVVDAPQFANAYELAKDWGERIAPTTEHGEIAIERLDPAARRTALAEVRAALESDDLARVHAALRTIAGISRHVDVTAFRSLVEPHAREGAVGLRPIALYALHGTGPPPGGSRTDDLPLVHAAWDVVDAKTQKELVHHLALFGDRRIEGRSAALILPLLLEPDSSFRDWINGLWGAAVDDRIANRLVELVTDPSLQSYSYDAFYYALSTLMDKQPAVVDALVDIVASAGERRLGRALWGLGFGIPEADQRRLATALVARWSSVPVHARDDVKALVKRYGTAEQRASLED